MDSLVDEKLTVSNYCTCFIDLLGQRNALAGQSLLPDISTEKEKKEFLQIVKNSVGAIEGLQRQAEEFIELGLRKRSSLPSQQFSNEQQKLYSEMTKSVAKQQRWSDGLLYFSSIDTSDSKCPMGAVLEMFMLAGALCFLGLATKQPIRGAIEVSWGLELHDNELYGAAVANCYELESNIAQYPRIVEGDHVMTYLRSHLESPPDAGNRLALFNRNCAQLCLNMTAEDQDGYIIIDYLGGCFTDCVTGSQNKELFSEAYEFICEQYHHHKQNRNSKLALRYTWLRGYFNQHRSVHT